MAFPSYDFKKSLEFLEADYLGQLKRNVLLDVSSYESVGIFFPKIEGDYKELLKAQEKFIDKLIVEGENLVFFQLFYAYSNAKEDFNQMVSFKQMSRFENLVSVSFRCKFCPIQQRRFIWKWLAIGLPKLEYIQADMFNNNEKKGLVAMNTSKNAFRNLKTLLLDRIRIMDIYVFLRDNVRRKIDHYQVDAYSFFDVSAVSTEQINRMTLDFIQRTESGRGNKVHIRALENGWNITRAEPQLIKMIFGNDAAVI